MSTNQGVEKLQWVGLVVLVWGVSALIIMLMIQQRQYRAEAEVARAVASAAASADPSASGDEAEPAESQAPSPSGASGSSAPASGEPSASPAPSASASEDPAEAAAAAARAVVGGDEDIVISVLGDSTGDVSTEWVGLWARSLGQDASVALHSWNAEAGTWYREPRTYGSGDRRITLYNGSPANATPATALQGLDALQPEPADLTILNLGHRATLPEVQEGMPALLDELGSGARAEAPVVVTVQNPATGDAESQDARIREAVRAEAKDRGLPVIDVEKAFEEAGDPADLLVDTAQPNEEGNRLWTETVSALLSR